MPRTLCEWIVHIIFILCVQLGGMQQKRKERNSNILTVYHAAACVLCKLTNSFNWPHKVLQWTLEKCIVFIFLHTSGRENLFLAVLVVAVWRLGLAISVWWSVLLAVHPLWLKTIWWIALRFRHQQVDIVDSLFFFSVICLDNCWLDYHKKQTLISPRQDELWPLSKFQTVLKTWREYSWGWWRSHQPRLYFLFSASWRISACFHTKIRW